MNITIRITYTTRGLRSQRAGSFPLRGRTPEKIAGDWIQEIKKEMDLDGLIHVIVDGKEDITEAVKYLVRASSI
jgi:uncharacterized metal-binding protein YceD (DUF177 family)